MRLVAATAPMPTVAAGVGVGVGVGVGAGVGVGVGVGATPPVTGLVPDAPPQADTTMPRPSTRLRRRVYCSIVLSRRLGRSSRDGIAPTPEGKAVRSSP